MFEIPIQPLLSFVLVLVRMLLFFSFLPVFGDLFTPMRVRVLLAASVAFVFAPLLPPPTGPFPESVPQFVALMVPEVVLGMAFGLVGRMVFGAVQFAGQIIGEQIGFGAAQVVDPSQSGQVPVLAQTLYVCSLLVFFTTNAHHVFFAAMARSFEQAPPGMVGMTQGLHFFFVDRAAQMFVIGVQMSLPIIAVAFAINVATAMVAKAVPQMHVFFENFIVRIMVGLLLLSAIIGLLVQKMIAMFEGTTGDLATVLDLMRV